MTHQDQTIEQPINTAMITMLEACGFQVLRAPAGDHHLVKGMLESAAAFYTLTVAGADATQSSALVPEVGLARVTVGAWEEGVLMAAAVLVATHDQPTMAATILNELGQRNADCSGLDEFHKIALRKVQIEGGIVLRGLEADAVFAQGEKESTL